MQGLLGAAVGEEMDVIPERWFFMYIYIYTETTANQEILCFFAKIWERSSLVKYVLIQPDGDSRLKKLRFLRSLLKLMERLFLKKKNF